MGREDSDGEGEPEKADEGPEDVHCIPMSDPSSTPAFMLDINGSWEAGYE